MVNRWNAVRAEAAEEEKVDLEEATAVPSLEMVEQRKRKRIAEWRGSLSSEETGRSANFVPLVGDWRERVARAKRQKAEADEAGRL